MSRQFRERQIYFEFARIQDLCIFLFATINLARIRFARIRFVVQSNSIINGHEWIQFRYINGVSYVFQDAYCKNPVRFVGNLTS